MLAAYGHVMQAILYVLKRSIEVWTQLGCGRIILLDCSASEVLQRVTSNSTTHSLFDKTILATTYITFNFRIFGPLLLCSRAPEAERKPFAFQTKAQKATIQDGRRALPKTITSRRYPSKSTIPLVTKAAPVKISDLKATLRHVGTMISQTK